MRCSRTTLTSPDRPILSLFSLSRSCVSQEQRPNLARSGQYCSYKIWISRYIYVQPHTQPQSNQNPHIGTMPARPPSTFRAADLFMLGYHAYLAPMFFSPPFVAQNDSLLYEGECAQEHCGLCTDVSSELGGSTGCGMGDGACDGGTG